MVIISIRTAIIGLFLFVLSCSTSVQSEAGEANRWVLLNAPSLLPEECEMKEPCTGTVYVRAPLADWKRLGEFDTFQQCGRNMGTEI